MHLVNSNILCKFYQRQEIWKFDTDEKVIYLTFDDGPIPEVTPWVLNVLKEYKAKATFFCVGDNVRKHKEIFDSVLSQGHSVGNHSYSHLNGWRTPSDEYISDVYKCKEFFSTNLFRPPYGRIKKNQASVLKKDFTLVFWSVLPGDFDQDISPEKCLKNAVQNTGPGSVIVFHDSIKAFPNLKASLPEFLRYFISEGYKFLPIPYSIKSHKNISELLILEKN